MCWKPREFGAEEFLPETPVVPTAEAQACLAELACNPASAPPFMPMTYDAHELYPEARLEKGK